MLYSYNDYENAYYKSQVTACKEIGIYLLNKINNKQAKQLIEKLNNISYSYDLSKEELDYITDVLSEVKIILNINL